MFAETSYFDNFFIETSWCDTVFIETFIETCCVCRCSGVGIETFEMFHTFVETCCVRRCSGVRKQIEAFREGVQEVFAASALLRFSPAELQRLFCGHQSVIWTAYISDDWLKGSVVKVKNPMRPCAASTSIGLCILLFSVLAIVVRTEHAGAIGSRGPL